MVNKRWLFLVVLGWILLLIIRMGTAVESGEDLIFWMVLQQLWLIFGSLMAVKGTNVLRWDIKQLGWGLAAGVGMFVLINVVNLIMIIGLSQIFGAAQIQSWLTQEQAGISMLLSIEDRIGFLLAAVLITLGASISEELLFRGALLKSLLEVMRPGWAVFIGALFFALVHFYVIQFIPVLISGIILGSMFTASNNLIRPIAAHAVVNTLALLIYIL